MGLFNSEKSTTSLPIGSSTPSTTTPTKTTTETNDSSSTGGSFLDVIGGIFGASGSGSNKANTGSGDPASSIVSSLTNVASAWINGDANKQVAKLNVEAEKLMAQAEASKADQALYDALKAQAETKTNEATQLANRAKSNNLTNWLLVASVLALAFGIIYLVFKAVFGWTSKKQNPIT
ncbi:hypothetical protein VB776_06810 [Arcicella sp. DC2W]|uniref:Uncharacterized protein n=1 Tax=Arcicella gelida TaxID=2984195 RepID=A0ABU5S2E6_9BACT|nr:hypothetical protein [Arcicella sp. DC2W]MEA5402617.1 hypothetical protein [Arcicella sp. DC2W]